MGGGEAMTEIEQQYVVKCGQCDFVTTAPTAGSAEHAATEHVCHYDEKAGNYDYADHEVTIALVTVVRFS